MNARSGNQATYDLTNFTIREMSECGKAVRVMGEGVSSMEETTARIVRHFHDRLVDMEGRQTSAMIRFYRTHPFRDLDNGLQDFATGLLGDTPSFPDMKCLVLLASTGDKPEWNSRESSRGHKAIPLPSEEAINQAPMVSNLIRQLGLPVGMIVRTDPKLLLDIEQRTFNVFYVPEALGSLYIPAQQEFVIPCGIRSVLGFGGLLPSGEMFAVIMFLKISISRETVELFKALSLNVKMALLPFDRAVFSSKGKDIRKAIVTEDSLPETPKTDIQALNSRIAALTQLIIGKEIDNSKDIISDLLDYCQDRSPRREPVAVHELIRQSRERCAIPENIWFHADLPETLPQVLADPLQMGTVFRNLIANAVQAMPNGGSVRVSARQVRGARNEERENKGLNLEPRSSNPDPSDDFVEISITDTGTGISRENMERLFQPLFTTKSRGIGLGLTISQKFTEANGGRIEVESKTGKGTTFTIFLPASWEGQ